MSTQRRTIISLALGIVGVGGIHVRAEQQLPPLKRVRLSDVSPANLDLNLTVPEDYAPAKAFPRNLGAIALVADSDQTKVKGNGDFSSAEKAVIRIAPSADYSFDAKTGKFSFEDSLARELTGATSVDIVKRDVRGTPTIAVSFEHSGRKLYVLSVAAGSAVLRISYIARNMPRDYDDALWNAILGGL